VSEDWSMQVEKFINKLAGVTVHYDCGGCDDTVVLRNMKQEAMRLSRAYLPCPECEGTGEVPSDNWGPVPCVECDGYGWIKGGKLEEETDDES